MPRIESGNRRSVHTQAYILGEALTNDVAPLARGMRLDAFCRFQSNRIPALPGGWLDLFACRVQRCTGTPGLRETMVRGEMRVTAHHLRTLPVAHLL